MTQKLQKIVLPPVYGPADFEARVYACWEQRQAFSPRARGSGTSDSEGCDGYSRQIEGGARTFVIAIPPPNITGVLHMGHCLNTVLQDIVIRYQRMAGACTLWIPGTDHAGIATQHVVERALRKEGIHKREVTREQFVARTQQIKDSHQDTIRMQLRKMGASCDWTCERFTLDAGMSASVREAFVTLYERGLLYRSMYLVNWCPRCGTALSDDEVFHQEKDGALYYVRYPLLPRTEEEGNGVPPLLGTAQVGETIIIATTRPETILADVAVAVHPDDARYQSLIGRKVCVPMVNRIVPIIADSYVAQDFGTGMVKITPAHDPNDWDIGTRHSLEAINMLNPDGSLNDQVPAAYRGLSCAQARIQIVADLQAHGLLSREERIVHSVGVCYRCEAVIEPYLSLQWFVKMKPLASQALAAWKRADVQFHPKKWENTYVRWLEHIRDWCISRQLWWGHRIPVWYCAQCAQQTVSRVDVQRCAHCGSADITQDPDVLDTWFSSWLWPFSTLGWPQETQKLRAFYPTSAVITAYDIIFFWVARMIMAGLEFTQTVPFRDVYLHGLVRDKQGRKMSKSLNNGVDPLHIIRTYGADALRFTLAFMCAQGQDVLIEMDSFKMGSRFANKVWNASRYILGNLEGRRVYAIAHVSLTELDRWIFHTFNETVQQVRTALEAYRFNDAAQAVYEFFWNSFCDWYVEASKCSFQKPDEQEKDRAASVLCTLLEETLRLLHPFLPFVTEEIYRSLPPSVHDTTQAIPSGAHALLMCAPYPVYVPSRVDARACAHIGAVQEIVRAVRTLRAACGIDPQKAVSVRLRPSSPAQDANAAAQVSCVHDPGAVARTYEELICVLAGISSLVYLESDAPKPQVAVATAGTGFELFLVTTEGIDRTMLCARLQKAWQKARQKVQQVERKLADAQFCTHAPEEVVTAERKKLAEARATCHTLAGYLADMNGKPGPLSDSD
ncbi:valine--tRNA ligase [Treponema pallidum subsp. endemicum]|uniref:valine--tRNA ligase n=1 Tax=Treponema pallidum TaxID=160 RepID=UPI001021BD96|nr:valine--tRNA ligase [Treponema pallidum]QBC42091.1 valine--tRNA ligase [Treponema pallidum subsp. endemicum]